MLLHWRKCYGLWTHSREKQQFEVKNMLKMDCFLQTCSVCPLKMLTDGLEWCGLHVMFLSAIWALILTAPIH